MIAEFERQVENLSSKGYPKAAGLSAAKFAAHLDPLRDRLAELDAEGAFPFVIVVKSELLPASDAIGLVERREQAACCVLEPDDLARFEPIQQLDVPYDPVYVLADIDTGEETLNVTPDDALQSFEAQGRSPLTIDEGIALVTHHPEAVAKNGGFSLVGSRCGDRRVTALWLSEGRPKLGWCWAGNPHTWLGSASCGGRLSGG